MHQHAQLLYLLVSRYGPSRYPNLSPLLKPEQRTTTLPSFLIKIALKMPGRCACLSALVSACVSECVSEFVRAASPHIWAYGAGNERVLRNKGQNKGQRILGTVYMGKEVSFKRSLRRSAPELG